MAVGLPRACIRAGGRQATRKARKPEYTDYTEKQIKPQITRKGSEVMALRARIDDNLARSAIIYLLALVGTGDVPRREEEDFNANVRK
jgi:hypothetical protein